MKYENLRDWPDPVMLISRKTLVTDSWKLFYVRRNKTANGSQIIAKSIFCSSREQLIKNTYSFIREEKRSHC